MSDLIDRQAATSIPVMPKEERNYRTYNLDDAYDDGWNDALASVGQLPSAEPERKRGKWIHRWSGCGSVWLEQRCSECGLTLEEEPIDYNYCPNCGADMREEK